MEQDVFSWMECGTDADVDKVDEAVVIAVSANPARSLLVHALNLLTCLTLNIIKNFIELNNMRSDIKVSPHERRAL